MSISDLLVITCALALGFSWAVAAHGSYEEHLSVRERSTPAARTAYILAFGTVVGLQLVAPMIMATQFLLRGRRRFLSRQELLWFTPLVVYLVTFVLSHVLGVLLGLQTVWLVALSLLGILASGCLASGLLLVHFVEPMGDRDGRKGWYWGDYLGCLSCIAAASYVLWEITTGLRIEGI